MQKIMRMVLFFGRKDNFIGADKAPSWITTESELPHFHNNAAIARQNPKEGAYKKRSPMEDPMVINRLEDTDNVTR